MVAIKTSRILGKDSLSPLQLVRTNYSPRLPPFLKEPSINVTLGEVTNSLDTVDAKAIRESYPLTFGQRIVHLQGREVGSKTASKEGPLRIGVLFCGRQSPGGHNVISGLLDALKARDPGSSLIGFIGGTVGLFSQETLDITPEILAPYRNQGGFDLLGRTKDQIRSPDQLEKARATCEALQLDGLVLIGGCQTASDAALLAEYFVSKGSKTKVVAVPVTINGDLKNSFVETTVGFDTTCKVYSQLISNICTDALSAEKYYYFIRLMGREASHVTLECALQSHPNMVILGEEVTAARASLVDITKQICDMLTARSLEGKHHGVILLPEGLINNIPEFHALVQEISNLSKELQHFGEPAEALSRPKIESGLSPWSGSLFRSLPAFIQEQLLLERESDGSVQLSQIETEKLICELVEEEMARRTKVGLYKGKKFNGISYFFGYQARGSLPSNFDCDYAYTLGHVSAHLLASGVSGYMSTVSNLKQDVAEWTCAGVPITAMMLMNRRFRSLGASEMDKPAVVNSTVDMKGAAYGELVQHAISWMQTDDYCNPGPLQFEGSGSDSRTITLSLGESGGAAQSEQTRKLKNSLEQVKALIQPGCPPAAEETLQQLSSILLAKTAQVQ